MSRNCPNCVKSLSAALVLTPRLSRQFACPYCGSSLQYAGIFWWGTEVALLAMSFAIYCFVVGNFEEFLIVSLITLPVMIIQYRYCSIEAANPSTQKAPLDKQD